MKNKLNRFLILFFGTPMIIGLIVGIIYLFISIFNPNNFNIQMMLAGWAAYFVFGMLVPDKTDE